MKPLFQLHQRDSNLCVGDTAFAPAIPSWKTAETKHLAYLQKPPLQSTLTLSSAAH